MEVDSYLPSGDSGMLSIGTTYDWWRTKWLKRPYPMLKKDILKAKGMRVEVYTTPGDGRRR